MKLSALQKAHTKYISRGMHLLRPTSCSNYNLPKWKLSNSCHGGLKRKKGFLYDTPNLYYYFFLYNTSGVHETDFEGIFSSSSQEKEKKHHLFDACSIFFIDHSFWLSPTPILHLLRFFFFISGRWNFFFVWKATDFLAYGSKEPYSNNSWVCLLERVSFFPPLSKWRFH